MQEQVLQVATPGVRRVPLLKHLELATMHVAHEEWLRMAGAPVDVTLTAYGAWVAIPYPLLGRDLVAESSVLQPDDDDDETTMLVLKYAFPTLLAVLEHAGRLGCSHVHFSELAPTEAPLELFP